MYVNISDPFHQSSVSLCPEIMNPFGLFPVITLRFLSSCMSSLPTRRSSKLFQTTPVLMCTIFTPLCVAADAPKIVGAVAVFTWEGNPANISCEVEAHPGASVIWFKDGLQLPSANYTNLKIHNTPTNSYLEVCCTFLTYQNTTRLFLQ